MERLRNDKEALEASIRALEDQAVAEALQASDSASEADLELPVVAYGVGYQLGNGEHTYYASNSHWTVQCWLGREPGVIEPLVRKADADRKIRELSDMVISLSETQEKGYDKEDFVGSLVRIHELVSCVPATTLISKEALLGEIDGSDEVVDTITSLHASDGLVGMPMNHGLILYPAELNTSTVELATGFALSMMIKLRQAEIKYGHNDDWICTDWLDECKVKLRKHLEKGDPRDVANYAMFLWYHQQSTRLTD